MTLTLLWLAAQLYVLWKGGPGAFFLFLLASFAAIPLYIWVLHMLASSGVI